MKDFENVIYLDKIKENNQKQIDERILSENTFFTDTKTLRKEIQTILNHHFHKRVEIFCNRIHGASNIVEQSFEVRVYEYNNFDYDLINLKHLPDQTAKGCADSVIAVFNNPELKEKYVYDFELTSQEKLFLTWLQSTGMNQYYELTPEGTIYTELKQVGFSEYTELFIQDFSATYDNDICTIFNDEYGKYVLTDKRIEKVN